MSGCISGALSAGWLQRKGGVGQLAAAGLGAWWPELSINVSRCLLVQREVQVQVTSFYNKRIL